MRRPRRTVPQRRRFFIGCEGESERAYVALLGQLLEEQRQDAHLDIVLLSPGGGDPLTLAERAHRKLADGRRRGNPPYVFRAILLDADRLGETAGRDVQMQALCEREGIHLIWQRPCHEALLLRHLPDCGTLRPQTKQLAMTELRRQWQHYEKGLSALRLAERIGLGHVRQARAVEADLHVLLQALGFE